MIANANPIIPVARARLEQNISLDVAKLVYSMGEQALDSVGANAFFLPVAAKFSLVTSIFGAELQVIIERPLLASTWARASAGW
eukprot:CAMPEP_0196657658 /NCGR_PEP_ID=MMETSP1086-20130531/24706_1 /TAXON_ID=77921 /ORGANISM="Cyanoptyche  gloeocystis , Strain SAG4.97" /LENGTH=83 /DNA_ID=CAMNT_0041990861 /DNA_START=685 /DNA_END=933 /DNA_ORIENTATION=-